MQKNNDSVLTNAFLCDIMRKMREKSHLQDSPLLLCMNVRMILNRRQPKWI